jgi:opacity protein-like surface antigen
MIVRVLLLVVAAIAGATSAASAQQKEPLPVAVLDLRGASVGLPTTFGWTPPLPEETSIPSRSYGFDVGGHWYPLRGGSVSLGLGANIVFSRGVVSQEETGEATASPAFEVKTRLTSVAPQVSVNFGHRYGWSYLSGGIGRARVRSEVSPPLTPPAVSLVESEWVQSINWGGGARWFINDHVAFSLDLRWHRLPDVEATATRPAAGKTSLIVAGGGISIK